MFSLIIFFYHQITETEIVNHHVGEIVVEAAAVVDTMIDVEVVVVEEMIDGEDKVTNKVVSEATVVVMIVVMIVGEVEAAVDRCQIKEISVEEVVVDMKIVTLEVMVVVDNKIWEVVVVTIVRDGIFVEEMNVTVVQEDQALAV